MSDLFNPELYVSDVSVYYGSKCAVQNVSFNIQPGQLTAIIGNNGYSSVIHQFHPSDYTSGHTFESAYVSTC
jgi:ABC-type phosphonate transport system ATPase subunit